MIFRINGIKYSHPKGAWDCYMVVFRIRAVKYSLPKGACPAHDSAILLGVFQFYLLGDRG